MKVLVLANFGLGLFKFRKELLEELIKNNNEVFISLPNDEYVSKLKNLGCKYIETNLSRRGTNPFKDLRLLLDYIKMIYNSKPDIVLTYTIKPNVYGGMACMVTKTPYLTNITGLGTSMENRGLIQKITLNLYKIGLKKSSCVFFQNDTNRHYFVENIIKNKTKLIPGSGVNIDQHKCEEYPNENEDIRFLFIGRIMKDKGIDELIEASKIVKDAYPRVQFDLIGGIEESVYDYKLAELTRLGLINYYGQQDDVHSFIKKSHATILPSYHEGTANVLLESASSGRPVLASRVPGCIETFNDDESGLGFEVRNVDSLVKAIIKFIELPYEQKRAMGLAGRRKMENEYDRNIVIQAYMNEINKFLN